MTEPEQEFDDSDLIPLIVGLELAYPPTVNTYFRETVLLPKIEALARAVRDLEDANALWRWLRLPRRHLRVVHLRQLVAGAVGIACPARDRATACRRASSATASAVPGRPPAQRDTRSTPETALTGHCRQME